MIGNLQLLAAEPIFNVQLLLDGLLIGAIFALAAYGLALVWGVMNVKNLAQGDLVIMGGYIAWVLTKLGVHPIVGLPIAIAIGMPAFYELLQGAHEMDEHFLHADLSENMPVIMALFGIWYTDFAQTRSHAILPYDQYLRYLPDYLQQADMESNGKRVTRFGRPVEYATGPVIWGTAGTDGQHAFYQLIHQGTQLIPCDFLVPVNSHNETGDHHQNLFANCLAQTEALMRGKQFLILRIFNF